MTELLKYTWQLLLLSCFLLLCGILLIQYLLPQLDVHHYLYTLLTFTLINFAAFLFMLRGLRKKTREGAVILLAGISGKFLLYLFYILVFWLVTKNVTKGFIVTFFTLYLLFTFFTAGRLLKLLKNK